MMKIIDLIKDKINKHGVKYTINLIIDRLSNKIFIDFFHVVFSLCKTDNTIVIESHNDFDCNGGAFYDYILRHELNKEWKVVWLVANPIMNTLPSNVLVFNFWEKNIKKEYYLNKAKFLIYDDKVIRKRRRKQVEVYCSHGIPIKNVKGSINVPNYVDYILSCSENYDPYICDSFSVPFPNKKMLHFGYPFNDVLFTDIGDECRKIVSREYSKKILWMPTFRQKEDRNDSLTELPLGIPLLETLEEYNCLNELLKGLNCLLIIKIHPMQSKQSYEMLHDMSNIIVLDGEKVKELNIDNYRMMKSCDAMVSDYSSITYSFLLLNRPIAFVLSDLNVYKPGFLMNDYEKFLPGDRIYTLKDFKSFIVRLLEGEDYYSDSREELTKYLYEYRDGNACFRLAEFFNMRDICQR